MKIKLSIRNQLIFTFTLFSLLFALSLCLIAYYFLELAEFKLHQHTIFPEAEVLAEIHMEYPDRELFQGERIKVYLTGPGRQDPLPEEIERLGKQSGDLLMNGTPYEMVYLRKGDYEYYFLHEVSGYEEFETTIVAILFGCVFGISLLGAALGVYTSNRFLGPLTRLAVLFADEADGKVSMESRKLFDDDEFGLLAGKIFEYDARLKNLVSREQAFTANVSHELRNPIFAITGATEILSTSPSLSDEDKLTLDRIHREARVMSEKVDLLLSLARGADAVGEREPVDVVAVLHALVAEHESECREKEVDLSLVADKTSFAHGNVQALTIIMRNILSNAIQYSDKGNIEVLLNAKNVVVEDAGPGIPSDMRGKVFERFYRGASSLDTTGNGIGLSLVRELCNVYGWNIVVETALRGTGTRVTFEFS